MPFPLHAVTRISRRSFLSLALAAGGAGLLSACSKATPAPTPLPTLTPAPTQTPAATHTPTPVFIPGLADFLKLSALLLERDDLDPDQGRLYFLSLQDTYTRGVTLSDVYAAAGGFDLRGLPAGLDALRESGFFDKPGVKPVVDALVDMWYSSVYMAGNDRRAATQSALAWTALTFAHPPAQCGGLAGYWAIAPRD